MIALFLGASAAFLIGFSKTGVPGTAMPAVALMAAAFRDETRLSVGAMVPLLILGDLLGICFYRRHVHWRRLWELVPFIAVGMVPGYFVLRYVESEALRRTIGVLIASLLCLHVASRRYGWQHALERWWFTGGMGLLAGFGTVVGNAAGPAMSIYLVGRKLDKHEFLGTSAWLFFFVNSSKVPLQAMWGIITLSTLRLDACVFPVLIAGSFCGVMVHKRIPQRVFNTLVLALAALAATHLILF